METEGKGFTVKDRRSFGEEGDLKEPKPAEKPASETKEEKKPKEELI